MNGLIFAQAKFANLEELANYIEDMGGNVRLDKIVNTNADGSVIAKIDLFVPSNTLFEYDVEVLNVRPYKFNKNTFKKNKNGSTLVPVDSYVVQANNITEWRLIL